MDNNRGAPTKESEDAISLLQKFSLELEAAAYDFMRAADFMQGHSLAIAQRLNTQHVWVKNEIDDLYKCAQATSAIWRRALS